MSLGGTGSAPSWFSDAARRVRRAPDSLTAAMAAVMAALLLAGVMIGGRAGSSRHPDAEEFLRHIDENPAAQLGSAACRVVMLVLCVVFALRLAGRVREHTGHPRTLIVLSVVGPLSLAAVTVLGWVVLGDTADDFMHGPLTESRAQDLLSDDTLTRMTIILAVIARMVFGAWLVMICLLMGRADLTPPAVTLFGMAGGLLGVLLDTVGDALFFGWLASVVFLAWGYWPGGRLRGWDREPVGAGG
jgi:hypothetical protein